MLNVITNEFILPSLDGDYTGKKITSIMPNELHTI